MKARVSAERKTTERAVAQERAKRKAESDNELLQSRSPTGLEQSLWENFDGPKRLALDIKSGFALTNKPKQIYYSREEYQVVSLDYFRRRLYAARDKVDKDDSVRHHQPDNCSSEFY